jgi:hypothetical protein
MNNHDQLQQLTLWSKEVLDALAVPLGCPQGEAGLERQPAQQEGLFAYIQLPLPGCEPEVE